MPQLDSRKPSARSRLLAAADQLFYQEGIGAVGVDRVTERAGVAKGSLYYNFGSKEELVRVYLSQRHAAWASRVERDLVPNLDPRSKILGIFETLGRLHSEPGYNGCAFTAASREHLGAGGIRAVADFRIWLSGLFLTLSQEVGIPDPAEFSSWLVLLYDGANVAAQTGGDDSAAYAARHVAEVLLHDVLELAEANPRAGNGLAEVDHPRRSALSA